VHWQLRDRSHFRCVEAKTRHSSDYAFPPDSGSFDGLAIPHHNQQGDHSGERKVYLIDFIARLVQQRALSKMDGFESRMEKLKVTLRKRIQQLVADWPEINGMH
jgi:hypothetical protein